MRAFYLTVALLMVAGIAYATDPGPGDFDLYTGYNMIGISRVPFEPAPWNTGGTGIFNPEMTNTVLHGKLQRWDATTQIYPAAWNRFNPANFGNCLLGDGYWFNNTTGAQISVTYNAVANGVPSGGVRTDMWVSAPGNQTDGADAGGQHMIATPFDHAVNFNKTASNGDNLFVTDGTELKTLKLAGDAGWCDAYFWRWDNATGVYVKVHRFGVGVNKQMVPDTAYWWGTYKDNLALIVPAYN